MEIGETERIAVVEPLADPIPQRPEETDAELEAAPDAADPQLVPA
jgi:hypothetical protein